MTVEERVKPAATFKPEVASLNMGSMNFGLYPMLERQKDFKHDWERPYLEGSRERISFFVQSVFGILGGIGTHPEDVAHMKRTADRLFGSDYRWSVLGAGRNQMAIAAQAAAMGGSVRVGLEDSLWIGPGQLARSNAEQVTKVRQIIEGLGLEVATPDDAREMLALKGGDKVGF
jgi:uncharacterized protein (DUF849 family)